MRVNGTTMAQYGIGHRSILPKSAVGEGVSSFRFRMLRHSPVENSALKQCVGMPS